MIINCTRDTALASRFDNVINLPVSERDYLFAILSHCDTITTATEDYHAHINDAAFHYCEAILFNSLTPESPNDVLLPTLAPPIKDAIEAELFYHFINVHYLDAHHRDRLESHFWQTQKRHLA